MIDIQTVYLDVYFLINFSVNGIALYFAAMLVKIPTRPLRLISLAFIGATVAVALLTVFNNGLVPSLMLSLLYLIAVACLCSAGIKCMRRIKLVFIFMFLEIVVGGVAQLAYNALDRYLYPVLSVAVSEPENRRLLLISLIILLSVGIFKMLISFFSGRASTYSVDVRIGLNGKSIETDAFVDTGNLARDPMDSSPVLIVKSCALKDLLDDVDEFVARPQYSSKLKNRLRLIPINTKEKTDILIGFKADNVSVRVGDRLEPVRVTVAIDKEGGSYDGCYALMPSVALDNVF